MSTSTAIRSALALGLGLALATAASPAQAADFTVTFPAGVACPLFDLTVSGTGGNAEVRVIQDHAGRPVRVISAGTGSALVFTNESTQETLSLSSNGAVTRTTLGANGVDTVSVLGHTVIILFPTDQPPGPDDHPVHRQLMVHDDRRRDLHAAAQRWANPGHLRGTVMNRLAAWRTSMGLAVAGLVLGLSVQGASSGTGHRQRHDRHRASQRGFARTVGQLEGHLQARCSGFLASATVFITANHCFPIFGIADGATADVTFERSITTLFGRGPRSGPLEHHYRAQQRRPRRRGHPLATAPVTDRSPMLLPALDSW